MCRSSPSGGHRHSLSSILREPLLNPYHILVFRTGIPFGILLHPVDLSLAACRGDGDKRRVQRHALRGDVDYPYFPLRPPSF